MNEEEDMILPDDFDESTPAEVETSSETDLDEVLNTNEALDESLGEVDTKQDNSVNEEQKLLEMLKGKVKYDHGEVQISSIDDVVTNYQKGLNYDRIQDKVKSYEESKTMQYINEKAKELGFKTADDYIESVKQFEIKQKEEKKQADIDEMLERGIPDDVVKEIIETRELREHLKQQEAEMQKYKDEQKSAELKQQEQIEFLKAYPDIKVEDIPAEVFQSTKDGKSLLTAYIEHENKQLKTLLEQREKQDTNKSTNLVKKSNGDTQESDKDTFLQGFDEM